MARGKGNGLTRRINGGNGLKSLSRVTGVKFAVPEPNTKWMAALKEALTRLGRGLEYVPEFYPEVAYQMAVKGLSHRQMGAIFGVSTYTIRDWTLQHPDFQEAMKQGRLDSIGEIENALFRSATGYDVEFETTTIKSGLSSTGGRFEEMTVIKGSNHVRPSPPAIMFWLCNRARASWKSMRRRELEEDDENLISNEETASMKELSDNKIRLLISSLKDDLGKEGE